MSKSRTGAPDGDDNTVEMTSRSIGGVPEALTELLLGFNRTSCSEKRGLQGWREGAHKNQNGQTLQTVTFFRFQWSIAKNERGHFKGDPESDLEHTERPS